MAVKIAIDFGSEFITIYHRGEGVILKEPSVVITSGRRKKTELVASGSRAVKMLSRLEEGMNAVYPIRSGAVANAEACSMMLKDYIDKVAGAAMIKRRVEAVTLVSCGLKIGRASCRERVSSPV
jgi:rod shape-determining protein MreB